MRRSAGRTRPAFCYRRHRNRPRRLVVSFAAGSATDAAALHAGVIQWPRLTDPQPFEHEGTRAVAYPGDPLHTNSGRAMPGPTRLIFRNGYFEPFGEFEELFA